TGRMIASSVWVPGAHRVSADDAMLASHALLDGAAPVVPQARASQDDRGPAHADGRLSARAAAIAAHPSGPAVAEPAAASRRSGTSALRGGREGWAIGPVPRGLTAEFRAAARRLRTRGGRLLALFREGGLFGLIATEPELEPLAGPLIAAARRTGLVVAAG